MIMESWSLDTMKSCHTSYTKSIQLELYYIRTTYALEAILNE
jgi:hypothetical protein